MGTKEILEKLTAIGMAEFAENFRFCSLYQTAHLHNGEVQNTINLTIFLLDGATVGINGDKSIGDAFESILVQIRKKKTDYSQVEEIEL